MSFNDDDMYYMLDAEENKHEVENESYDPFDFPYRRIDESNQTETKKQEDEKHA